MLSIGEYVRWPVSSCLHCMSKDLSLSPQPQLRMRVKCNECNHAYTVDPELTEQGLAEVRREFIAKLVK